SAVSGATAVPPLSRRAPGEPALLSYGQQRLWFLHRLEPMSAAYNMPGAVHLSGELDVTALERALSEIVARHEALRTTFSEDEHGSPVAVVHAPFSVSVATVDVTALSPAARDEAVALAVRHVTTRPFDLTTGPLLRAAL